jgi:glutaredoxin
MLSRLLTPFLLGLALAGCDFVAATPGEPDAEAQAASEPAAAEARPAGWESLDAESSATRLYYQYVDARNQVRFVERLEDVPQAWRPRVGFVKMSSPPPLSPGDASRTRAAQLKTGGAVVGHPNAPGRVVLYSATWCGACRKAKRYLDRQGIAYEERDVDNPHHAAELVRKTGQRGIPVLEVRGRIMTGFSEQGYDRLIAGA